MFNVAGKGRQAGPSSQETGPTHAHFTGSLSLQESTDGRESSSALVFERRAEAQMPMIEWGKSVGQIRVIETELRKMLRFSFAVLILILQRSSHIQGRAPTLGIEDGYFSLTASSSHDPVSVGPERGRLNAESGGGAWCPSGLVNSNATEFLEVDLGATYKITSVLTQGRFANGDGREFAEQFMVEYWRPEIEDFVRYVDAVGKWIFEANSNTYSVSEAALKPPPLAQKIRVRPFARYPRTVCMRIELKGYQHKGDITSYAADPAPYDELDTNVKLEDDSFDGTKVDSVLKGGLGQLTDGVVVRGTDDSSVLGGYDWVGWRRNSQRPLRLSFHFSEARDLTSVSLFVHPENADLEIGVPRRVVIECGGDQEEHRPLQESLKAGAGRLDLRFRRWCHVQEVHISLDFTRKWLLVSEVEFHSTGDIPHVALNVTEKKVSDGEGEAAFQSTYHLALALTIFSSSLLLLSVLLAYVCAREQRTRHKQRQVESYFGNLSSSCHLIPEDQTSGRRSDTLTTTVEVQPIYSEPVFTTKTSCPSYVDDKQRYSHQQLPIYASPWAESSCEREQTSLARRDRQ